MKTDCHR